MNRNVLVLTDFVGYGEVSLVVQRTILEHMGFKVLCLPTVLLSNTWNYGAPAKLDTNAYMKATLSAWEKIGITFDAVLLGYLADTEQAQWLSEQCKAWKQRGITVISDPLFADNGKPIRAYPRSRWKSSAPFSAMPIISSPIRRRHISSQASPMKRKSQPKPHAIRCSAPSRKEPTAQFLSRVPIAWAKKPC